MAGNDNGRDISRRQFTATLGAVAGLTAGANLLTPAEVSAAPHINPRIIGANDRVVVASIGVRGQGNSVKRGFAKLANVEIKTLCDVDENVGRMRLEDKALAEVASYKPGYEQDLRKVYADKDVDAVIIATPEPLARARHHLGRCRRASTSTSRSPRATPWSKAGAWCRRRRATRRSSRSAR